MEIRNIYLVLLLQIKAFTQHLLFKYTMVGNWNSMIRRQNKDGSIIMKHECAALIGLFHAASSVLPPLDSYRNYLEPTQRGVQGYLSSLQRRVLCVWFLPHIYPTFTKWFLNHIQLIRNRSIRANNLFFV